MTIRVVVCDDHGIVRSGIRRILDETPDIRLEAAAPTGALLLQAVADYRPEVVVLDIRLSDGSGLDLLGPIAEISPETRVVMLSMYDARGYVEKAKARGARGYVTKDCLDQDLLAALRGVMQDKGFVSFRPEGTDARAPRSESALNALSSRELEVLRLLAGGLTNSEVAEELGVSPRTVESHRAGLQRKLLLRTRAELARAARDAGLMD
ncbi:MAG TPA: response regulator transcription factor [Mycobacteriales bacterium]|jgi:DNA-binding NarL/FixJ family response regulator|nr:response regulator transcription factor [Mycobacteriales bacterium]